MLWAIAYRVTGCAADADEIVQESYARALERPPAGELRPWLVRVATNLARDRLRGRRREGGYKGPFVPSPVDEEILLEERASLEPTPEARFDLAESATLAFLTALEALSAKARAVLVLRDVLDLSVEETAAATGLSVPNVKVTHHRARRVLARYERPPANHEQITAALLALVNAITSGDIERTKSLLTQDAIGLNDANGEFIAAGVEVRGAERVAQVYVNILKRGAVVSRVDLRVVSGSVAIVADMIPPHRRYAPRMVFACDLAPSGQIARVYTVLATRKLTAVRSQA